MLYDDSCQLGAGLSASRRAWERVPLHELSKTVNNQFYLNMKKTIIALIALASIAMAETADLKVGTTTESTWTSGVTFNLPDTTPLTLTFTSISGAGNMVGTGFTSTGDNLLSPKIGFEKNADNVIDYSAYIDIAFTLSADNSALESAVYQLDVLTLNLKAVTSGGGSHSNGIGAMDILLLDSANTETVFASATPSVSGTGTSATLTLSNGIALDKEQSFVLRITRHNPTTAAQGYVAITGGSVTYSTAPIPEPTTATLSLLALAGLAARRRRASR